MVLSLKPRFADAILAGAKTVELRRSEPKIVVPTRALVYATSPARALAGTCIVTSVKTERLATLWRKYGPATGISHQDFLNYFEGVEKGTALTLVNPASLPQPIPLTRLRETPQGFRPPQSFAYVEIQTGTRLLQAVA